jgi:signal transduction histidine kinase/DNA-binding NarL/FixJ family response regulator
MEKVVQPSNGLTELDVYNILMQSPVAICILRGKNFIIEFANDFYLAILGKERDVIGKPLFHSFPELKNQGFDTFINGIMDNGVPYTINEHEVRINKNGKDLPHFFNCVYQPLRENNNIISGVIVVFTEVTEMVLTKIANAENQKKLVVQLDNANVELAFQNEEKSKRAAELGIANIELAFQKKEKGKRAEELGIANIELAFQDDEKEKRAVELGIANIELAFQDDEKEKRAAELGIANIELAFQKEEKGKRAAELGIANEELVYQNDEKEKRAEELIIANKELVFQNEEKEKRADELFIANKELVFQNEEKEKRAAELIIANEELVFQNEEKEKRAAELSIANKELIFQNEEKEKRAAELIIANKELAFQNAEKGKRADELFIANKELIFQSGEKKKRAAELVIADIELAFQDDEKEKRAAELGIANIELAYQKEEKGKRAAELGIANEELVYQNDEKEKRAEELIIANKELVFQNGEKEKRANELIIANKELVFQNKEKEKRAAELGIANKELIFQNNEKEKRAAELIIANKELAFQNAEKGKRADELFIANKELVFQSSEKEKRAAELVIADIELVFQNKEKEKREIANKELEAAKTEAESATLIAEEAVKSKQQFLSNMSHEIRTPMNAIIGFTKVVLRTDLTAKQREYLTAIKTSGDSLIVLINDILDLAKVDAGKMSFEKVPFKLALSLSAMLHLFETKIQEKNLVLIKEYDPKIPKILIGDPVRLHQIILNLVSNAVKFTETGNITVSVNLISEDTEKANIEFAVTDTGIGITDNKMTKIFDNFQQASSNTARLFGGTGLGLAIVKQLVEQQGGTVAVKSVLDEGSTFSFSLDFPKTDAKDVLETEIVELTPGLKNVKVLVVEDMALNQLLMRTILDDFGFERDIAANGRIAIEKLQEQSYDIILMDLQMPEMNGFEATDYIRNTMKSNIPIIALTADVTTVDLAKCKSVGMNDYLAKPIDERLLYSKIVGLVKKPILVDAKKVDEVVQNTKPRCTNLDYLNKLTKSNPVLMMEMIAAYLAQTPTLIHEMKHSFEEKDWTKFHAVVHKMIPSFSIMGMNISFETMAKKILEDARSQREVDKMADFVGQLETVCLQACEELTQEFNILSKA